METHYRITAAQRNPVGHSISLSGHQQVPDMTWYNIQQQLADWLARVRLFCVQQSPPAIYFTLPLGLDWPSELYSDRSGTRRLSAGSYMDTQKEKRASCGAPSDFHPLLLLEFEWVIGTSTFLSLFIHKWLFLVYRLVDYVCRAYHYDISPFWKLNGGLSFLCDWFKSVCVYVW